MRILLSAQDNASGVISQFASSAKASVAGMALVGAAAIIGFGAASVKMAADYEQSMNRVQALTGSNSDQMKQYDQSVKALAVDAGVAPTKLADGLYNVLSAGYKGADAMKVLTLATEDAKIGMTSSTITTDALTNVMASFSVKVKDATRVNGEMLETVTLGKATFQDYATSIVKSASSAAQFHVSMETMNAAWATMTANGIKAKQASTDFQQSLKVMYGNIGTVTKSLHSNGIAFDETAFNAMDYGHKVQYLNQALQEANDKHVKVTGVTLQAAQAISTISNHIGMYNSNLATLSDKQAMANKTQEAWATTQAGFNQQMSRLSAAVQVLMIDIGSQLLPVLTRLVSAITPVVAGFAQWISTGDHFKSLIPIIIGVLAALATIILVTVVPAMIAWAVATLAATWPLLLIAAIVGVAVALIVVAIQHWGAIMAWIRGVLQSAWAFIVSVWNAIKNAVSDAINFIVNIITQGWQAALVAVLGPMGQMLVIVINNWGAIRSATSSAVSGVVSAVSSGLSAIPGIVGGLLASAAGAAFAGGANIVNSIASGIRSAIGAVSGAISDVASFISAHLPHSPAKIGPLKDLQKQGAMINEQIAKGMLGSKATLGASLNATLSPIAASPLQGSGGPFVLNVTVNAQTLHEGELDRVAQYTLDAFSNRMRAQYGNVSLV